MAQTINKFFLGNTYPNKLYVGNNVISRVYYGTDQIWGFPPPTIMQFVEKIDNTTSSGPTIPNYVDNSYIAFLLEYSNVASNILQALPVGWTGVYYGPSISNKLAISYKILTESDRNTTVSSITSTTNPTTNRDQMYIFKKQNSLPITSAITGNIQYSSNTILPTIVAPVIDEVKSAILIHYYYNSADTQPDLVSTPPMDQILLSGAVPPYYGGQYKIYNFGSTPTNTTITSTLAGGTIRQIAFWVTIQ
jgi:hypothetical protein